MFFQIYRKQAIRMEQKWSLFTESQRLGPIAFSSVSARSVEEQNTKLFFEGKIRTYFQTNYTLNWMEYSQGTLGPVTAFWALTFYCMSYSHFLLCTLSLNVSLPFFISSFLYSLLPYYFTYLQLVLSNRRFFETKFC
jgi:hypothetical protein